MDEETADNYPESPSQIARTRRFARLTHCGTVRLINGTQSRTYANSWVPEGEERVIDVSTGI